jgi:hypothetical protein
MPDPSEAFETWLLHRVAEAVEGREVSADLLTDIQAEIAEARERPPEARNALALMELAERINLSVDHLTELLATLQAQSPAVRERLLGQFVEAWLVRQREACEAKHRGGDDG